MNQDTIYIVVIVTAKEGHREEVLDALWKLIDPTREEEGNISYNMHQDIKDPNTFVFYEHWKSQEAIDAHLEKPYLKAYAEATQDKVEVWNIMELTRLTVD